MMAGKGKKWTAVVLTCQRRDSVQAFQHELSVRQEKGLLSKDIIMLTVEDPKTEVGSGGATLNALLVVAEHISARQGYTVVNSDVLEDAHILIIHMGRQFPFDSCGRSFACLPLAWSDGESPASLMCSLDVLLHTMSHKVAAESPPGVWICSSDMLLDIPSQCTGLPCKASEACVISVPGTAAYASSHGVYKLSPQGIVQDILYKGSTAEIQSCCLSGDGMVPLVSGVVYLGSQVAVKILGFHVVPPLDSCTYIGLDSGSSPIQLSLFFDIMLCMCSDVTEEAYISGERSGLYGKALSGKLQEQEQQTLKNARSLIWKELHDVPVRGVLIEGGRHNYMDLSPVTHHRHLSRLPVHPCLAYTQQTRVHSFVQPTCCEESVIINSSVGQDVTIGSGTVVSHCQLEGGVSIGQGCMLNGIQLPVCQATAEYKIADNLVIQEYSIHLPTLHRDVPHRVLTVFGRLDNITEKVSESASFCNQTWQDFYARTGISSAQLWDSALPAEQRCMLNARLYPVLHTRETVGWRDILWLSASHTPPSQACLERWKKSWRLSLEEIISFVDVAAEFKRRRELFFHIGEQLVRQTLLNCEDRGWNTLYASAAVEGYAHHLLGTLDKVAEDCESAGIAARTLANIADVLGNMAGVEGGLRSGPAANKQWATAFDLLEKGSIANGVRALAAERNLWLNRPDHLVRAARHYEGAAQILIRHAVMSARQFIQTVPCQAVPMGKWITAECPARIDISGGWSDTPPITYEHGGAVINAAVLLDDLRPIGAKVNRIPEPHVVLQLGRGDQASNRLVLTELSQFADFCQPHATGALLKTAFICVEIVTFPSTVSLREQLLQRYGGGFELHTWSELPHGSGLGTSSILAGAIMAALLRASGKMFDIDSLNHAVLHLEQMLTTGGGWQDQVGGMTGGIKVGHSKGELPLRVHMTFPVISAETVQAFSDRLVLVYTGRPRLARNLLQNVVRNWYARNPDIVETENQLVSNAWTCAAAFERGDLAGVGECMNIYWEQKKKMAPGCEPHAVRHMMDALAPHTLGVSLAGAGGGGFMYVLTKEANALVTVRDVLSGLQGTEGITVHSSSIDHQGLRLHVEGTGFHTIDVSLQ